MVTDKHAHEEIKSELIESAVELPNGTYVLGRGNDRFSLTFNGVKMSSTLVTNRMFAKWLDNNPFANRGGGTYRLVNDINVNNPLYYDLSERTYRIREGFEFHPVRGVTWVGAALFCCSVQGRLPMELEWEISALSGDGDRLYPWGNDNPDPLKANYGNIVGDTTAVATYPANEWGIYDMAGNLREWCMDEYHPNHPYYLSPSLPSINSKYKVVKGGAWDKAEMHLASQVRAGKWGRIGTMGIGFRVLFD